MQVREVGSVLCDVASLHLHTLLIKPLSPHPLTTFGWNLNSFASSVTQK